ncbi:MAG: hypothetical protein NVS4B12_23260 [Ktedonobacteraceae bacterium]
MLPALKFSLGDPIFIGDFWGTVLALPIALFLAFWLSNVKNKVTVIGGALVGVLIGFLGILCIVGTLIHPNPLPHVDGVATFFSTLLLNSALGLSAGILIDVVVARRNERDYQRQVQHE